MNFPAEMLPITKELYPRIYNAIEVLWGYPELGDYLNKLTMDTRGDTRAGFPVAVGRELLRLQTSLPLHNDKSDKWSLY